MDTLLMATSYLPDFSYILLAVIFATLIALHYYVETTHAVKLSLKLPHPPRVPIIGHFLQYPELNPKNLLITISKYTGKYGPVISVQLGTQITVFLTDAQDVEVILSNPEHITKAPEYKYFTPWLGDSILFTHGTKWLKQRKTILDTFRMKILRTYISVFYENSQDLVRRLGDEINQRFDCHDYLSE
ncbi:PREDICTED: cytochrome P450 4g1-like, partial [Dinoponera quadriceps]|uniref:Cytochrome P450 4g1-like n=1 Tax=Dinoponera quadriceps TaxID=609295 RepID=A0A6P3Y797_DINQU